MTGQGQGQGPGPGLELGRGLGPGEKTQVNQKIPGKNRQTYAKICKHQRTNIWK